MDWPIVNLYIYILLGSRLPYRTNLDLITMD